jgi:hypothetical protein
MLYAVNFMGFFFNEGTFISLIINGTGFRDSLCVDLSMFIIG